MYIEILEDAKSWTTILPDGTVWEAEKKEDAFGQSSAPLHLKVLGVFRVISKGYHFDGIAELCGIHESTLAAYFHPFVSCFVGKYVNKWINDPARDPINIRNDVAVYKRLGFPGAVASADCTHVRWNMCPDVIEFTGKEGYPTIAYEVCVNHSKFIRSVTIGHPGTRNDKTIVKMDPYIMGIHNKEFLHDVTFDVQKLDGTWMQCSGAWLICDNGYHLWRICQCPIKGAYTDMDIVFNTRFESVRKDVECTFGVMKNRFRILKSGFYYHTRRDIDGVFHMCSILHNMLLVHDGNDIRWRNDASWSTRLDADDDDIREGVEAVRNRTGRNLRVVREESEDYAGAGSRGFHGGEIEEEDTFKELRNRLVSHFWMNRNTVEWNF